MGPDNYFLLSRLCHKRTNKHRFSNNLCARIKELLHRAHTSHIFDFYVTDVGENKLRRKDPQEKDDKGKTKSNTHFEIHTQDRQNYSCIDPLISHKSIKTVHILPRRRLLIHQGIQRRPESSGSLLPGGDDFITGSSRNRFSETSVVEEVVVGPVVE